MYRTEIEVIWENEESIRKDTLVMLSRKKIESDLRTEKVFCTLQGMIMAMTDNAEIPASIKVLSSIELNDELGGYLYDSY